MVPAFSQPIDPGHGECARAFVRSRAGDVRGLSFPARFGWPPFAPITRQRSSRCLFAQLRQAPSGFGVPSLPYSNCYSMTGISPTLPPPGFVRRPQGASRDLTTDVLSNVNPDRFTKRLEPDFERAIGNLDLRRLARNRPHFHRRRDRGAVFPDPDFVLKRGRRGATSARRSA